MNMISRVLFAMAITMFFGPIAALAQSVAPVEPSIVSPNSWFFEIWEIVSPVLIVIGTPIGLTLAGIIAGQVIKLLGIQDANANKELEEKIRTALHSAALNGLKYAMAKYGLNSFTAGKVITPAVIGAAIEYIRSKSPDTAKQAGVSDEDLEQIILSKAPDVKAILGAGALVATVNNTVNQSPNK